MLSGIRPVLFMLMSTLSLSVNGLVAKYLSSNVSVEWLSFIRFLLPALIVFAVLSLSKISWPDLAMWKPLLLRGISIAACQICFLVALEKLTLVESVVLFATGPLFIPVLEKLFFGESIRWETRIGLLLTFTGVLLLAGDKGGFSLKPELFWGLAAGLCNAFSQLSLFRSAKSSMKPLEINAWGFSVATICILPFLLFKGLSNQDIAMLTNPGEFSYLWLAILALALLIINTQYFRAKAYQLAPSNSQLAPLIFTNLIFTAIWQKIFFEDSFTVHQLIGVGLIVSASMLQVLIGTLVKSQENSQLAHR